MDDDDLNEPIPDMAAFLDAGLAFSYEMQRQGIHAMPEPWLLRFLLLYREEAERRGLEIS